MTVTSVSTAKLAERRKLETHPKTGAAQMVEVVEVIQEVRVPSGGQAAEAATPQRRPFAEVSGEILLGFGVPSEWVDAVQRATEDSILGIAEHLPAEAAEALLELATGGTPRLADAVVSPELAFKLEDGARALAVGSEGPKEPVAYEGSGLNLEDLAAEDDALAFQHPDAQRRFRTIESPEELQRALEFPWDKWTVFLHPQQRSLIEREQSGPARVSGSAGTGKTIVALHRAVHLAREHPEGRVLLATYSVPLANALAVRLRRLVSNEPRLGERIDVGAIPAVGARLYRSLVGPLKLASREAVVQTMKEAAAKVGDGKFTQAFLMSEWDQVVDAWQVNGWEGYRDVARLGRKTRLREDRRKVLWATFENVQASLAKAG